MRPDHDLSRVEPHPRREVEAERAAELGRERRQLVADRERRETGALRVVLVCDRGAEESHDAVAGVLVDRSLEAVDAGGEDLEVAVEHLVPDLFADAAGELLRSLDVGEEHRHLLALAFERGARGEDLLGNVLWRVGARVGGEGRGPASYRRRTLVAELGYGAKLGTAACTLASERSRTFFAELCGIPVLMAASGALHPASSFATCSARIVAPISVRRRWASESSPR